MLLLLAGAPGAGKTTIARVLCQQEPKLRVLQTWTTRPPRADDPERRDYCYVSESQFSAVLSSGDFFETINFGGFRYGTRKEDLRSAARDDALSLIVMNLEGALAVRAAFSDAFLIYLNASLEELTRRLAQRGDQPEAVSERIRRATDELQRGEYRAADVVISSSGSIAETASSVAKAIHLHRGAAAQRSGEGAFPTRASVARYRTAVTDSAGERDRAARRASRSRPDRSK